MLSKTLSKEGFLAFLESQNPAKTFMWMDYCRCPAAMYAKAAGIWDAYGLGDDCTLKQEMLMEYSQLAIPYCATSRDTYGACAKRVREQIYGT